MPWSNKSRRWRLKMFGAAAAGAAVVAGSLFASPQAGAAAPAPLVRPISLTPSAPPAGSVALGSLPASQPLALEVVLAPSNEGALQALLKNLADPRSPEYHHFLQPGQFAESFGPSPAEVAAATSWLHSRGLTTTAVSGFAIQVHASAHDVSAALGTSFRAYRTRSGTTGYLAAQAPLVPAGLADGAISSILGLNTLNRFTPPAPSAAGTHTSPVAPAAQPQLDGLAACNAATAAAAPGYYTLDQLGADYGVGSLINDGLNGRNQTVALFELSPHSPTDTATYGSCFGLHNSLGTVQIDGGGTASTQGTSEADLDIEQVATQAPGSSLISYEGPNTTTGSFDTWSAIVQADTAHVISTSWGECEPLAYADGSLAALSLVFEQAATQGQTILAASGDGGSESCFAANGSTVVQVLYPASDIWVTAVGGTSLPLPSGAEIAWNDCQHDESTACAILGGAGGGGLSRYETALSYQPSILQWPTAAPEVCGTKCREVPDISANAGVGMVIFANGFWSAEDGTSFAAPFIAGLLADKNTGCTTATGAFNPALYGLAAEGVYTTALNQITSGDTDVTGTNDGAYPASAGYNAATGLGSPIAAGLACPEITTIAPSKGLAGSTVTITGLGLEKATISFGSKAATVLSASSTAATVIIPAGTGVEKVTATSILGTGTITGSFAYEVPTPPPPPPPPVPPPCVRTSGAALASAVAISAVNINGCGGYYVADASGQVSAFGAAKWFGDPSKTHLNAPIIAITATPDGRGYWLLAADGGVFTFGDAAFYGSTGGQHLNAPVVGMAVTPDNRGYWIVAKDGGVFSYGDARFHGSTGGITLNKPVDGIAVAPGGDGYWLVASDGGVFAFTPDGFYGSLGSAHLNQPIIGMSSTPNGRGYTLVGSDGGVFTFGDAPFYGSLGADPPATPIVDLAPTPADNGYYIVDSGGGVFVFGPGASYLGGV